MDKELCKQVNLWGVISDEKGLPLENKNVRLMKKIKKGKRASYLIVQECVTTSRGIYSFKVEVTSYSQYKVMVIGE